MKITESRIAIGALVSGVIALLITGGVALPAQAEEAPPINPNTLSQLRANFNQLGVDPSKQEGLLVKYEAGDVFDNSSGVTPVSVTDYRVGITNYERSVYADGSVSLTSVEHPTTPTASGGISPMGLSGCTYMLSAGVATFSNCKVEKNNGVLTMMYHASYWQAASGAGVSLANAWDWNIQAAGGACSKDSLGTPTSTKARLRAYCTVVTGIGSSYPYLDLDVTKTSANVNANW